MNRNSALRMNGWDSPGRHVRLTRLNIYSGLLIELGGCRILVDPSKVPGDAARALAPDLILVSHESMDHFDPDLVLSYLCEPDTRLVGSWGVMVALGDLLSSSDPRWNQVFVGLPGARFTFGDIQLDIESSRHCEYAAPLFFDIRDRRSGFRILDVIDSDITDRMKDGIEPGADVLVVPIGIALGASPEKASEMVRLLAPSTVFASHFTREGARFAVNPPPGYGGDRLIVCSWHEGVTLDREVQPAFDPDPHAAWADLRDTDRVPSTWMVRPPAAPDILGHLERAVDSDHLTSALYFAAWESARGADAEAMRQGVLAAKLKALDGTPERVAAAFLLALGVSLGRSSALVADLAEASARVDAARPYLSYWALECWGRAGVNPDLRQAAVDFLQSVATNPQLWGEVGIRRKLMCEVERLVKVGARWLRLPELLTRGAEDANPDVRLLSFKLLPLVHSGSPREGNLLLGGLNDPHEDVIEWVIRAHIDLFDSIDPAQQSAVRAAMPRFLTHATYQVREQASALVELLEAVP